MNNEDKVVYLIYAKYRPGYNVEDSYKRELKGIFMDHEKAEEFRTIFENTNPWYYTTIEKAFTDLSPKFVIR